MKRTDFTFRKAWMIYTVYFLLLFTPTANAQQTSRPVSYTHLTLPTNSLV